MLQLVFGGIDVGHAVITKLCCALFGMIHPALLGQYDFYKKMEHAVSLPTTTEYYNLKSGYKYRLHTEGEVSQCVYSTKCCRHEVNKSLRGINH